MKTTLLKLTMKRNIVFCAMAAVLSAGVCRGAIPVVTDSVWHDTDGHHINCHGGGILKGDDGVYYWYGEHRGYDSPQQGVACYTSADLVNWDNRGIVMPVSGLKGAVVEKGSTIERPKVIFNRQTEKYVMLFHHELKGRGYAAAQACVAVADTPLGPFVPLHSGRVNPGRLPLNLSEQTDTTGFGAPMEWWTPRWYELIERGMFTFRDLGGGQMSRDMTLYVDDDGVAYHIYSSEDNLTLHIAELNDDYTSHTGRYIRIFPGGHNEAPVIFRKDGRYWMITSGCTGWEPNEARMMWADDIMGEWHQVASPCRGEGADKTFGAQGTFILCDGEDFTFMADIWTPKALPDSRHLWLPVSFDKNGVPVIEKPHR